MQVPRPVCGRIGSGTPDRMTNDTQPDTPDRNPTDEELDVEGPNESTQPSDSPVLDDEAETEGEVTES